MFTTRPTTIRYDIGHDADKDDEEAEVHDGCNEDGAAVVVDDDDDDEDADDDDADDADDDCFS